MSEEKVRHTRKSFVLTAVQGIQNPTSARKYGRDSSKGAPNIPLLENIKRYVQEEKADLRILAIPGSYVNELELDEAFRDREDVYMDERAFARLEAQRRTEQARREEWDAAKDYAEDHGRNFRQPYPENFFWGDISNSKYPNIDRKLNKKMRLIGHPEPSQNQDPAAGNTDLTSHLGTSVIFGHPKQRFKVVPKKLGGFPRILMTTGCCTHPNYNATNRRGSRAERDHTYGFAVVDVLGPELYLPRLVPARKDGTFIDLGIKYSENKDPKKVIATALILGDLHIPNQDPIVIQANNKMIDHFQPHELYLHDVFDAQSINVHNADNEILEMLNYENEKSNLEQEVMEVRDYLLETAERMPYGKVRVVASNHDDMLGRWLAGGGYRHDKENKRFAYKILGVIQEKDWPLEIAVRMMGKLPRNVEFLTLTSDHKPWGYQCAAHGHKGVNGAKGTLKSLSTAYGKVIIGHVHQLEVMGTAISVGTSSKIPMDYQVGQPSTSTPGNAVIYEGGLVQALPIIKGIWKK